MNKPSARPAQGQRAFTLIELLVSIAIFSILIIFLAQVASTVAQTWTDGSGRAERRQNGRALIDFIKRELRHAAIPVTLPRDSSGAPIPGRPNLQFALNPASVPDDFKHPHALFWQAPIATDYSAGDMAVIGYFVRWTTVGGIPKPVLCRLFINPGHPDHLVYTNYGEWVSEDILNAQASAESTQQFVGLFAENVLGFWARCLDANGNEVSNGSESGFDSNLDYNTTSDTGQPSTITAPALPTSVEVSIAITDSATSEKITPAIREAIISLAKSSENAAAFTTSMQTNATLRPILGGTSSHRIQIKLENAP